MTINMKLSTAIFFILLAVTTSSGQVKLPKLVNDGMVLQRDAKVKIWGWASDGENISVQFIDSAYNTTANKNGEWEIVLSGLKAGGPYTMQINASNSVTINDIVVGDVWLCSGQSNMGLSLGSVSNYYKDELDNMDNPFLRQFFTFPGTNFKDRGKRF